MAGGGHKCGHKSGRVICHFYRPSGRENHVKNRGNFELPQVQCNFYDCHKASTTTSESDLWLGAYKY